MLKIFLFANLLMLPLYAGAEGLASIKVNNAPECSNVISIKHGLSRWHRIMNSNQPTASSDFGNGKSGVFRLTKAVDASSKNFYRALSSHKNIRHIVVALKSRPEQGYIQFSLEGVVVASIKPINASKYRRAAFEVITLKYEQIRWARLAPVSSGDIADTY
ncbi:MAG: hypothetical protein HN790_06355 [Methylococcales bacterium]|nr:hypothetical protein [Methylococcales bacterium]